MEEFTALNRKEVVTHTPAWLTLEDTVLHRMSQLQKDICYGSTYRSEAVMFMVK